MLKLLKSPSSASARVFRVLGYCNTHIQTISSSSSSSSSSSPYATFKPREDTLYFRILPVWDQSDSIIPILDQWVTAQKPVDPNDVRKIIKQLRKYKRFKHALEICEWAEEMKLLDFTPGDVAVQLDLISKVHGLEQAEKYFDNIPESSRVFQVYGALLNCYAYSRSLEKAEAIMQKMRDLGYSKVLAYNVMMTLYYRMGRYEKIDYLTQEMEKRSIDQDTFSFNIRLNAYAAASDIESMEKLLMKMEINPLIVMDWNPYVIAAQGYWKAGVKEKALAVLKKSEQLMWGSKVNSGYPILLTLYASMGKKSNVFRIWDLLKKFGKFRNGNYLTMISSLDKLDDLKGAENILEEWEAKKTNFDIRIPNTLVTAYCKRGHLDKAELLIKRLTDSGFTPNASTWSRMARGYCINDMEKALEMMKKEISASDSKLKLHVPTLAKCFEYLKEKGDSDRAEELIQLLNEHGQSFEDLKDRIAEYIKRGDRPLEELSDSDGEAEKILENDVR